MDARLTRLVDGRTFPVCAVALVAVRFLAPSAVAALGVQGIDTSVADAFLAAYDAAVPVLAAIVLVILFLEWPAARVWNRWYGLAVTGVAASLASWAGEVAPMARLVSGAWSPLPLTLSVSATILFFGIALDANLSRSAIPEGTRLPFRALYATFAGAYLLGGLRFIDYRVALGAAPPSGVLWTLDYGPTLVPCGVALGFWLIRAARPVRSIVGVLRSFGPPLAGALVGLGVAQGLGGFILSNVLAWGGGYEVFVPTSISLAFVGFAVGAFLATAVSLRDKLTASTWRLGFCGVSVTALSGSLFFDAALASLAGILLGLGMTARSFRGNQLLRT